MNGEATDRPLPSEKDRRHEQRRETDRVDWSGPERPRVEPFPPSPSSHHTHFSFPPWLQQLVSFVGVIIAIVWFAAEVRSEQRSTREELTRVAEATKSELSRMAVDMQSIKQSLPNKELYDNRLSTIESTMGQLKDDMDVQAMMLQKMREDLLKKGVI